VNRRMYNVLSNYDIICLQGVWETTNNC